MMNGAAGHTYGANGIWQVNRKDQPHGASPHGGNYGRISWDEAMDLPGSRQMSHGKKLFEQFPWHRFKPHPEWATFANESGGTNDVFSGPQATGLPSGVRLIYVPQSVPIKVHNLSSRVTYTATHFDPVTAEQTAPVVFRADPGGTWTCPPPARVDHDWVLIIQPKPKGKGRNIAESHRRRVDIAVLAAEGSSAEVAQWRTKVLPLPAGEGRGEGLQQSALSRATRAGR